MTACAPEPLACETCAQKFASRNALFRHLRGEDAGECGERARAAGMDDRPGEEKIVLWYGYIGEAYKGNSRSTPDDSHTVEWHLWRAVDAARGEAGLAYPFAKRAHVPGYSRASRTDAGVHAVANAIGFNTSKLASEDNKTAFVKRINEALPADIRVFGRVLVANEFHARRFCDQRTYKYVVPAALLRAESGVDDSLRKCMQLFVGRRSWHNFTQNAAKPDPKTDCAVDSLSCDLVPDGVAGEAPLAILSICASRFVFHQIRRIIGMLLALRAGIDRGYVALAFDPAVHGLPVPLAPGFALYLHQCRYTGYARRRGLNARLLARADADTGLQESERAWEQRVFEHCALVGSEGGWASWERSMADNWLPKMQQAWAAAPAPAEAATPANESKPRPIRQERETRPRRPKGDNHNIPNELHAALERRDWELCKALVHTKPGLLFGKNKCGYTPLMLLAMADWAVPDPSSDGKKVKDAGDKAEYWKLWEARKRNFRARLHAELLEEMLEQGAAETAAEKADHKTAADFAQESGKEELAARLRGLEVFDAETSCPLCGERMPKRNKVDHIAERVACGEETNPLVRAFFLDEEWAEARQKISGPLFHAFTHSHFPLSKELSETMSVLRLLVPVLSSGRAVHIVDLCCGKSLTAAVAALCFRGCPVTAVDLMPANKLPHYAEAGLNVKYLLTDVLAEDFTDGLRARAAEVGLPVVLLGVHCCGFLSVAAVKVFHCIDSVERCFLLPCCLPPKKDPRSPPELFETRDAADQYRRWAEHLRGSLGEGATLDFAEDVLSVKRAIVVGARDAAF